MKKRILSLSLILLFVLAVVPGEALAADVKNLELVNNIDSAWGISAVVESPKSDMLLIQDSYNCNVYLYNLNTGIKKELVNTLPVGVGLRGMCFSLDGSMCAVSTREFSDGTFNEALIGIFDTKSGELTNEIRLGAMRGYIAFDRDNNLIAYDTVSGVFGVGSTSGITVRNRMTGDTIIGVESDYVSFLCQNPTNSSFAAASGWGVKIYDGKTGGSVRALELGNDIEHMAYSPDGKYLVVSSGDKTTVFGAINNYSKIHEFDKAGRISFKNDGSVMVIGDTVYFAEGGFSDYTVLTDNDNSIYADSAFITRDGKYYINYDYSSRGIRLLGASNLSVSLKEIRLEPDVIELSPGEESELKLIGVYSDGSAKALDLWDAKFSISDFSVARINENSKIQGLTVGETELSVDYYGTIIKKAIAVMPTGTSGASVTSDVIATSGSAPAAAWAQEGINSAITKGFVPADIQGSYASVITRQEFCRMAVKFVEYLTGETVDAILQEQGLAIDTDAFSDTIDPDILAAYALGITSGTGGGKFSPNGQFTREQAATMLMNICKAVGMDVSNPPASDFTDINTASSWAKDGIDFVRANGIMGGTSTAGSVFTPKTTYTRQESIVTFDRIK
jgi:hypothetical protein